MHTARLVKPPGKGYPATKCRLDKMGLPSTHLSL